MVSKYLEIIKARAQGILNEQEFLKKEYEILRKLDIGTIEYDFFLKMKNEFKNYLIKMERNQDQTREEF